MLLGQKRRDGSRKNERERKDKVFSELSRLTEACPTPFWLIQVKKSRCLKMASAGPVVTVRKARLQLC